MNELSLEQKNAQHFTISSRRALRAIVVATWAGFFTWLWLSGEISRYLGPRTYWVVPFGAILLGVVALIHCFSLRVPRPQQGPSAIDMVASVMLVLPIVAVLMIPSPELGSLAASRKATSGDTIVAGSVTGGGEPIEDPTFRDIVYAQQSNRYSKVTGVGPGTEVDLLGFIDRDSKGPEGTIRLTRFFVSCCAADAIPFSVAVDAAALPPMDLAADSWAAVTGKLEEREGQLVVRAASLDPVPEPQDPYLY